MLNGKFYTGLPPKMVDRQAGKGYDRQQSHFFWPDESHLDSAVETRVKRRTSLQLEPTERPRVVKRLSTVEEPKVDTRQRFQKEFARSSIQFNDNMQEQPDKPSNYRPMLRRNLRREVTPKLTDVRPSPMRTASAADEAYKQDQRKQAYSSKIQFYDYMNEADTASTQNNARKPKMDMNDKRELERNTKNSPKLQIKRNVRNLSLERELFTPEREAAVVTKKPLNDAEDVNLYGELEYDQRRRALLLPKKILKHRLQSADESDAILDYVDNGVRQLRLRTPPPPPPPTKKHVTYNEQAEYEYFDDMPKMRTGSGEQQQQQRRQQQQQRPYVETSRSDAKSLNNNNKNSHNNNYASNKTVYNNNSNYELTTTRKNLPKLSDTAAATTMSTTTTTWRSDDIAAAAGEPLSPTDPRKHLRSSLCFNGDALVVDVGATTTTTAARRAARSSAMQRVSVGLPD